MIEGLRNVFSSEMELDLLMKSSERKRKVLDRVTRGGVLKSCWE